VTCDVNRRKTGAFQVVASRARFVTVAVNVTTGDAFLPCRLRIHVGAVGLLNGLTGFPSTLAAHCRPLGVRASSESASLSAREASRCSSMSTPRQVVLRHSLPKSALGKVRKLEPIDLLGSRYCLLWLFLFSMQTVNSLVSSP